MAADSLLGARDSPSNLSPSSSSSTMTTAASAQTTAPPPVVVVNNGSKASTIALTVLVAFFGAIILATLCWRIWLWRTSKRKIASIEIGEKPAAHRALKPILLPSRPASGTVWVPQWKPSPGSGQRSTTKSEKDRERQSTKNPSGEPSPPPSYFAANGPASSPKNPCKPTPKASRPVAPPCPKQPPPPLPTQPKKVAPHPYAATIVYTPASPLRTSSFVQQANITSTGRKGADGKRLPRLMTVTDTFIPSIDDELSISLGESVRLIEEYRDEWCLVERTKNSEKGVIPRFCLQEVASA